MIAARLPDVDLLAGQLLHRGERRRSRCRDDDLVHLRLGRGTEVHELQAFGGDGQARDRHVDATVTERRPQLVSRHGQEREVQLDVALREVLLVDLVFEHLAGLVGEAALHALVDEVVGLAVGDADADHAPFEHLVEVARERLEERCRGGRPLGLRSLSGRRLRRRRCPGRRGRGCRASWTVPSAAACFDWAVCHPAQSDRHRRHERDCAENAAALHWRSPGKVERSAGIIRDTIPAGLARPPAPSGDDCMRLVSFTLNGAPTRVTVDDYTFPVVGPEGRPRAHRHQVRVRRVAVRRVHGPRGRQGRPILRRDDASDVEGKRVDDHRGARAQREAAPAAAGLRRAHRPAVRLLHPRHDHGRVRPAAREPEGHVAARSSPAWTTTSAGAAHTSASSMPSRALPRREACDEPSRRSSRGARRFARPGLHPAGRPALVPEALGFWNPHCPRGGTAWEARRNR